MKKPNQKRIKDCLRNIEPNFTELVDSMIWYELHDMDDWASEIVCEIERLPLEKEAEFLCNDLTCRKQTDFDVYVYQRLWWALINNESAQINQNIISFCKNSDNGPLLLQHFNNWFNLLDAESETKQNISVLLNSM